MGIDHRKFAYGSAHVSHGFHDCCRRFKAPDTLHSSDQSECGVASQSVILFSCAAAPRTSTCGYETRSATRLSRVVQSHQNHRAWRGYLRAPALTAKQALAIVRSVGDGGQATGDHHAGYYYNLTGNVPDITFRTQGNNRRPYATDAPYMGTVISHHRPKHPKLPQVITLPTKPSRATYAPRSIRRTPRAGVRSFYIYGRHEAPLKFTAPSLTPLKVSTQTPRRSQGVSGGRQQRPGRCRKRSSN